MEKNKIHEQRSPQFNQNLALQEKELGEICKNYENLKLQNGKIFFDLENFQKTISFLQYILELQHKIINLDWILPEEIIQLDNNMKFITAFQENNFKIFERKLNDIRGIYS